MLVGKNKPVAYFSLNEKRNGSLRTVDRDTKEEEFFDWIEGYLVGIEPHLDNKFEGRANPQYHFKFESYDRQQIGILQIGEGASACRGLLASLVTIPEAVIRQVYVRPYTSTSVYDDNGQRSEATFVNVDVSYRDSQSSAWIRLIDLEDTKPLYKSIFQNMPKEDAPRREYLLRMCKKVNERLQSSEAADSVNNRVPPKNEYVDKHGEVHPGAPNPGEAVYNEADDSEPPAISDDDLPF